MVYYQITLDDINKIIKEVENLSGGIVIEELVMQDDSSIDKLRELGDSLWNKILMHTRKVIIEGKGKEVLNDIISDIDNEIRKIKDDIGEKYIWISEELSKKISHLWNGVFQMAIGSFPSTINKDNILYNITSYSISVQMKIGSDIKTSISELFRFLMEGVLSVRVRYEERKA